MADGAIGFLQKRKRSSRKRRGKSDRRCSRHSFCLSPHSSLSLSLSLSLRLVPSRCELFHSPIGTPLHQRGQTRPIGDGRRRHVAEAALASRCVSADSYNSVFKINARLLVFLAQFNPSIPRYPARTKGARAKARIADIVAIINSRWWKCTFRDPLDIMDPHLRQYSRLQRNRLLRINRIELLVLAILFFRIIYE